MCICINCKFVKNCSVYSLIEKQHQKILKGKTLKSNFIPYSSIIRINIMSVNYSMLDWDLIECISFVEEPGKWLQDI